MNAGTRRALTATGLAVFATVAVPVVRPTMRLLLSSWSHRVAVEGGSMEPLLASGDWLLVDPDAYLRRPPRPGELVLATDPRDPGRLLVKRAAEIEAGGRIRILGDAADASTDSRTFGAIDPGGLLGRPWLRYWPPRRFGRIS
jgi:nickel-type superoxide dismutase maturation protease